MPTTDRCDLPAGSDSSEDAKLDQFFLDPPSSARTETTEPCLFSGPHVTASC